MSAPAEAVPSDPGRTEPAADVPADQVGPPPAERRGRTNLTDRAVAKITQQAVSEVPAAAGVSRQALRMGAWRPSDAPRVSARLDGDVASVRVTMAVTWPASIPETTQRVREQVSARLAELASLRVAEVDIEVTRLVTAATAQPRRVS